MAILWLAGGGNLTANLLFASNLPLGDLLEGGDHLWSLCIEVQFYAAVAALCLPHRRALLLIPVLCMSITALRILDGQPYSIVTWHRVDEILAGGIIALIYCGWLGTRVPQVLKRVPLR